MFQWISVIIAGLLCVACHNTAGVGEDTDSARGTDSNASVDTDTTGDVDNGPGTDTWWVDPTFDPECQPVPLAMEPPLPLVDTASDTESDSNTESDSTLPDCEFQIQWDALPDAYGEPSIPVLKACHMVRLLGLPPPEDTDTFHSYADENRLLFNAQCNETYNPKWYFSDTDLLGQSWEAIEANASISECTTITLCPKACAKLRGDDGVDPWSAVEIQIGCEQWHTGDR